MHLGRRSSSKLNAFQFDFIANWRDVGSRSTRKLIRGQPISTYSGPIWGRVSEPYFDAARAVKLVTDAPSQRC